MDFGNVSTSQVSASFIGTVRVDLKRQFGWGTAGVFGQGEYLSAVPRISYNNNDYAGGAPWGLIGTQTGTRLDSEGAFNATGGLTRVRACELAQAASSGRSPAGAGGRTGRGRLYKVSARARWPGFGGASRSNPLSGFLQVNCRRARSRDGDDLSVHDCEELAPRRNVPASR